jgi:hypothetical protein
MRSDIEDNDLALVLEGEQHPKSLAGFEGVNISRSRIQFSDSARGG